MTTYTIAKSSDAQIQTPKRGTHTHTIELLSTDKFTKEQKIEVFINTPQATWIPYCHLKSRFDLRQNQEENKKYSSYRQTNYHIEKVQRQNWQIVIRANLGSKMGHVRKHTTL